MQGDGAAPAIAAAIDRLNRFGQSDVIIAGRGGGSFEDLFAFNEREVADAIYNSRIPVLVAVGHEIDQTIADLVADASAPTPSAAAQVVIPRKTHLAQRLANTRLRVKNAIGKEIQLLALDTDKQRRLLEARHPSRAVRELRQRVDELRRRTCTCLESAVTQQKTRVEHLAHDLARYSPWDSAQHGRQTTETLQDRIARSTIFNLQQARTNLNHIHKRLLAVSPYGVLKRGYSIVTTDKGQVIREYNQTKKGSTVAVTLFKGKLYAYIYKLQGSNR